MSTSPTLAQYAARLDPTTPEAIEGVDFLAGLFVDLEARASAAYAEAWRIDQPHEDVKLTLLTILSEIGDQQRDGSLTLAGDQFEIRLTWGAGNWFDPDKIAHFRGAMLRGKLRDI